MLKKCTIRIELMSDMCVSDGSAYNSLIDTDICCDRFGFPYIPAKRIRGCLRECALELNDWGDDIKVSDLFGDKGDRSNGAKVRIGNAYISNYHSLRNYVLENEGHVLVHPQNVLSAFSYIRTQTSIDYETGVADDKSLRTMRVADKGLVFIADVEAEESCIVDLGRCCKVLRHMGVSRTRGLGEVSVSLCDEPAADEAYKKAEHASLEPGAVQLAYEIDLLEPVICKSINGGEANTLDYIEGSKILGLISNELKASNEDYLEFADKGPLKCSNAYISRDGKRFIEVPGYIYKIKNDKTRYINKLMETDENKKYTAQLQLNQMKHAYISIINNELETRDVITEERYHHRRPDDKSVGRALANEGNDADFYQMDSISEGQQFAGYITGSPDQIKRIYSMLTADKDHYIGYSRSSEYGKVHITVTETSPKNDSTGKQPADDLVITLNAPTIVYNDHAMPSTDPMILVKEICSALKIAPEPKKEEYYIRNTTIGGYNVTWNMRKPTIQAFDKGTAIRMSFDKPVDLPADGKVLLGERTSEGFGEALVTPVNSENMPYIGSICKPSYERCDRELDASGEFASKLAAPLVEVFIQRSALEAVEKNKGKIDKEIYRPTVSNLMLMYKESDDIESIRGISEERFGKNSGTKEEKRKAATEILAAADAAGSILDEFCKINKLKNLSYDKDTVKMKYLKEYLTQLKYVLKESKRND